VTVRELLGVVRHKLPFVVLTFFLILQSPLQSVLGCRRSIMAFLSRIFSLVANWPFLGRHGCDIEVTTVLYEV
jgi:hypothetical protein